MTASDWELFYKSKTTAARKTLGALAGVLIFSTAMSYIFAIVQLYLEPILLEGFTKTLRFLTKDAGLALMLTKRLALSQVLSMFLSMVFDVLGLFLPFYLFSKYVCLKSFDQVFPLCGGKKLGGLWGIFACTQVMAAIFSVFSDEVTSFISPVLMPLPEEPVSMINDMPGALIGFLSLCILTPLIEEYVFRGVIFGTLRPFGFGFAAFSSAMVFGLAHSGLSQFAYAVAFGLISAFLREKTDSVRMCVLLHALNNSVSFLFADILPLLADTYLSEAISVVYSLILGVFALFGLAALFRKAERTGDTLSEQTEEVSFSAFFSVCTVVYILLFAYHMVSLVA